MAAEMSGNSAAAGATGAASGELAARYLAKTLYGADTPEKIAALSEEKKQNISTLSTVASGLAGGVAGDSSANALAGAQAGKNAVENNFLKVVAEGCAIAAPCRNKVAEQLLEIGAKAGIAGLAGATIKDIAGKMTPDELEHLVTLKMMGNDEITGKYLSSLQDKYAPGTSSNPNIGKDLTDEQKKDLGGSGSGTPGGHGPEDEEAGRNSNPSSDPKSRGQYEEYVDSLRASMEKPNVKDGNLKNIIDDLYRPNAKVGSGSTADAVRYELATGEKVGPFLYR